MDRALWMKQIGFGFVVVVVLAMLAGPAWADPTGDANVSQV